MRNHVAIIGSNGLIGRAIQSSPPPFEIMAYSSKDLSGASLFDISCKETWKIILGRRHKRAILLSWRHLNDYHTVKHITENLVNSIELVQNMIDSGLEEIVVAGTCYEYGLQIGCLSPLQDTKPITAYGISKNLLNQSLSVLCSKSNVRLCWTRIFFPYSLAQRRSSLLPSLILAHESRIPSIKLGPADLIRDFVPIDQVAHHFISLMQNSDVQGVFNCGTGKPISLRSFVEHLILKYSLDVKPLFNELEPRTFEPFAAWADMSTCKIK